MIDRAYVRTYASTDCKGRIGETITNRKNSSYAIDVSVCILVALYVRMFVARANKVEGTMI